MAIVKYWDNVFTEEELKILWDGIEEIEEKGLWNSQEHFYSASVNGKNKRSGEVFWLGSFNSDHGELVNKVNEVLQKPFSGFTHQYSLDGFWESAILSTTDHSNLLGYYDHNDHYGPHSDFSPFTAISWLNREPKAFSGGELFFPLLDSQIEPINNRMVIFPGHLTHEVRPIQLPEDLRGQKMGRYSLTQFLYNIGIRK